MLLARRTVPSIAQVQHQSSLAVAAPATAPKALTAGKYLLGLGGAVAASQSETVAEKARLAYLIPVRLLRDVYTAASIVTDYKWSLDAVEEGEKAAREQQLHACHQRSADKLLKLCFDNGGIYIKLGQHIGQLDHLLPEEYVVTMREHMLDKCPVSSYAEVRQIIQEDLGSPPEQLFQQFSATPIASASLAQVHTATTHDGRKVAVKVQHAGLRESCAADITTIEFLVSAARAVFPDFNYQWLVEEIKHNLPLELNFQHEAQNAARCRDNLNSPRSTVATRVHVPYVYEDMVSPRVLTMEFIDGVQVTDKEGLQRLGVSPRSLAQLVSETFNEMIFIHGDVHCDPHAANMLVRKGAAGDVQLVLLDHGLYRQIDDGFRREYAALWRALILADKQGIKRHAEGMNAGDAYPLFAAMLTMRPWDQIVDPQVDHLTLTGSRDEKHMLQGYAAIYAKQIGDLLLRMPRPLLLLLKTNDCLRSVDLSLGAPVNTFVITAKTCARALAELDAQQRQGVGSWLSSRLEVLRVDLAMTVMQLLGFWASVQRAFGWRQGGAAAAAGAGLGNGGVVYDEAVLQQHRQAAAAGVVLSAETEAAAAAQAA